MSEHSVGLVPALVRSRKTNGRCVYDKAAKRELVRRCLQPGVSLARTALEHGVNANLLRKWVILQTGTRPPRRQGLMTSAAALLAVRTESNGVMRPPSTGGYLELIVAGGTIRIHGQIDPVSLSVVLDCLVRRA